MKKIVSYSLYLGSLAVAVGIGFCFGQAERPIPSSAIVSNTNVTPYFQGETSLTVQTTEKVGPFSKAERKILFDLIDKTLEDAIDGKPLQYPDLNNYPEKWHQKRGVYVTLNIGEELRGSMGTHTPEKPFIYAVIDAAYNAAFNDTRFKQLTKEEFKNPDFNVNISVLGPVQRMTFAREQDVINALVPFKSSLLLTYGDKQELFLPSAWEKRPKPENFWKRLKEKVDVEETFWSPDFVIEHFLSENIRPLEETKKMDEIRIDKAIHAFKNMFNPDGTITYIIDFKTGSTQAVGNTVREMGSAYGMAYAYYMTHDKSIKPLLEETLKYADSISQKDGNKALVVDFKGKIKSGSTALALLALLYYEKESGDTQFANLREQWKNGLLSLFERGEGINRSPTDSTKSPYYEGETWLAFAVYNEFFPEDKELDQAVSELNEIMYRRYVTDFKFNFFHWGTQAAAKQYALKKTPLMRDYLIKQISIYLNDVEIGAGSSSCSYLEALGEVASLFKGEPLYQAIIERIENQLEVPRLLQEKPLTKFKNGEIPSNLTPYVGLFLNSYTNLETRNDITQHCLIAMLKANKALEEFE